MVKNFFPPQILFPQNIDSNYTLFEMHNSVQSVISTDNSAFSEYIDVQPIPSNLSDWPSNGYATISQELLYYDGVLLNTENRVIKLLRCARNLNNKTRFNPINTPIHLYIVCETRNALVNAILNIEDFVGFNFTPSCPTLDWRIRNLQSIPNIYDDFTCPEAILEIETISTNPSSGTTISYTITINGSYTSFLLDFGDGTSTTSPASGTHTFSINSPIDPIITIGNPQCTQVQSAIQRNSSSEPQAGSSLTNFNVIVPTIPSIPNIVFPVFTAPSNAFNIPPIIFPELNITTEIPSITISVTANFPSNITITPVFIPTNITFSPVDIPTNINVTLSPLDVPSTIDIILSPVDIDIPSEITFIDIPDLPTTIGFGPGPDIPSNVTFGPGPDIPTNISFTGCCDIPSEIVFSDCCDIPSNITFGPVAVPTTINFGPVAVPTNITFSPINIPTLISITPVTIPTLISITPVTIPTLITITPVNIPTLISFGPATVPTTITITPITIPPITITPVTIPPITFGPAPVIPVFWGTPPVVTCVVYVVCPSASPSSSGLMAKLPFQDGFSPELNANVQTESLNIPSEINLVVPNIPDIKVLHDIPAMIEVMPISDIKITGYEHIPKSIDLNVPTTISIIGSSDIPRSILVENKDVPTIIKLEMPDNFESFKIDATIQVVGIPPTIELKHNLPSEIRLVMPEDPTIELKYKGAPIEMKITLDESLKAEGGCFRLIPCTAN